MKSPFEIRYDLLALAHDTLEKQFQASTKAMETAIAAGQLYADAFAKFMPKYPTPDDIMEQAQKFGRYVDRMPGTN